MIAGTEVEFGKELGPAKFIDQLGHHRDGERVFHRDGVECPIVSTETPRVVGLHDEQHWRREGRQAAADQPLGEHGGTLAFQLIFVGDGVPVWPDRHGLGAWSQGDFVVTGAGRWEPLRVGEDRLEFCKEGLHDVLGAVGLQRWRRSARDSAPDDLMVAALEGHGEGAEVPQDWP